MKAFKKILKVFLMTAKKNKQIWKDLMQDFNLAKLYSENHSTKY